MVHSQRAHTNASRRDRPRGIQAISHDFHESFTPERFDEDDEPIPYSSSTPDMLIQLGESAQVCRVASEQGRSASVV